MKNAYARAIYLPSFLFSHDESNDVDYAYVPQDIVESWANDVDWREGNAMDPDVSRELTKSCDAVISTVGTMVDSTWPAGARDLYLNMKKNFQSGGMQSSNAGGGVGGALGALNGLSSMLAHITGRSRDSGDPGPFEERSDKETHRNYASEDMAGNSEDDTYEALNRDVHLIVAAEAAMSETTRAFVYFSAVPSNAVNSKVPFVQRYFATKMDTEIALADYDPSELRCTILRPTVMYDDEHLHTLAPAALSKLSSVLDSLVFARFGFRDVPHLLPSPPIFVDTVADCAIEAAFEESIEGIVGVKDMTRIAHASSQRRTPFASE